jgi:hypothetical protein
MSFRTPGRIRIPQWATVNRLVTANDITLDENGVEISRERTDLDGGIVYCTVKDASGTIVIQKDSTSAAQIEHLDQSASATKGQARIKFVEADTAPLTVGAHYTFDVWVSTADGRVEPIVDKGRFFVDESDTQISAGPAPALPTAAASQTQQQRSFQHVWSATGDSDTVAIPGTGMRDATYCVNAQVEDGAAVSFRVPSVSKAVASFTIHSSTSLNIGDTIDVFVRDR